MAKALRRFTGKNSLFRPHERVCDGFELAKTEFCLSCYSCVLFVCLCLQLTGCSRYNEQNGDEHPTSSMEVAEEKAVKLESGETRPTNKLETLLFEGQELHPSLITQTVESLTEVPASMTLLRNPCISMDKQFVEATARGGSQGRLDGVGMRAALYARYSDGKSDIGFYGLEAESEAIADQREKLLREIWAHNESLDRTRVYRNGQILCVVWLWTDGELPECWQAVKAKVAERLNVSEDK